MAVFCFLQKKNPIILIKGIALYLIKGILKISGNKNIKRKVNKMEKQETVLVNELGDRLGTFGTELGFWFTRNGRKKFESKLKFDNLADVNKALAECIKAKKIFNEDLKVEI